MPSAIQRAPRVLFTLLFLATACRRTEVTPTPETTAPSLSAGAARHPSPAVERVTLDEARFEQLQARFPDHRLLRAPAFAVSVPSTSPSPRIEETSATVVFGAVPDKRIGAFTAPVLGVVPDAGSPEIVELLRWEAGNLVEVDALEVREAEGSADDGYHSVPSAAGPGQEILLVASFTAAGSGARFRRGFHLVWTPAGHLVQSLASHAIRDVTTLADLDDLRRALSTLGRDPACPDLASGMDRETLALALQCMLEHDRREQIARSVAYPIEVLLGSGVVRTVETAKQLLELHDDVLHRGVRDGVRQAAADLGSHFQWAAYDGFRLGYAGLVVDENLYTIHGVRPPPRIVTILNDDPVAHERMNGLLASDNRALWQSTGADIVCRTRLATHVFSRGPHGSHRLATWYDHKASYRTRPPTRVLFGLMVRAGSGGNQFYEFIGPQGKVVEFEHITLHGPAPAYEYQVRTGGVDEPCENHEAYKGY